VGGNFTKVGDDSQADQSANYVAYWNISTSRWSRLGTNDVSFNNGLNSQCRTLLYDNSNAQLYVGGDFTKVRDSSAIDLSVNKIAIWKPSLSKWYAMGDININSNGTNGQILSFVYDSCRNVMYAGGTFTIVYDSSNIQLSSTNRIAQWNFSTSSWSRLGTATYNGTDGSCNALAMDSSNQILYIGGNFANVYDSSNTTLSTTQKVAAWNVNTQSWRRLGAATATTNGLTSTSSYCNSLVYDSSNSRLYVGGSFTKVGDASQADQSANYVAYWNVSTSRWSRLGTNDVSFNNGTNAYVNTMTLDNSNNLLYVGGNFTKARDISNRDISINYVGYWNVLTNKWGQLGGTDPSRNGLNNQCRTLVYDQSNSELYIGGDFTLAYNSDGTTYRYLYLIKWNALNSSWNIITNSSQSLSYYGGSYGVNYNAGGVRCYVCDNSNNVLYVGGYFTTAGNITANRIAKFDISANTWSALGSGMSNGYVNAIIIDYSINVLYAGGNFTTVSGGTITANRVAKYNISANTWSALGSGTVGVNNLVNVMVLDSSKNLYVGGDFTTAGSITVNKIAKYDTTLNTWSVVGPGTGGPGSSILGMVLDSSQNLYAGMLNPPYMSKYDRSANTWTSFANGPNSYVREVVIDSSQNLYVCGDFTSANSVANTPYIAKYTTSTNTWSALGYGLTSSTRAWSLILDSSQNIYVVGQFGQVGSAFGGYVNVSNIAKYDRSTNSWSAVGPVGSNAPGTSDVIYAVEIDNTSKNLYIGGDFASAYNINANYCAKIDITSGIYYSLGDYFYSYKAIVASVYSLAFDNSNNRLYVGGNFTKASDASQSDQPANYVAYLNTSNSLWVELGGSTSTTNGTNAIVNALALDASKNAFIGGNFTKINTVAGDVSKNYGIIWNPSTNNWQSIGSNGNGFLDGSCIALDLDSSNQRLYIGGSFTKVNDSSNILLNTNRVAYWNLRTNTFNALGSNTDPSRNGTNATVNSLAFDSTNNRVYVGGNFTKVSDSSQIDQSANYVAYWDATNSLWGELGGSTSTTNGTNALVNALALDASKNVFIGGNFIKTSVSSGDISANYGIIWNPVTSKWINLGAEKYKNGFLDGSCSAFSLDISNQRLYVGGTFTYAKDSSNMLLSTNRVAYLDLNTSCWVGLGGRTTTNNGINAICRTINYNTNNQMLYIGGDFTRTSNISGNDLSTNRIAAWNTIKSVWEPLGTTYNNTNNGLNNSAYAISIPNNNQVFVGGTFTLGYDISGSITANYGLIWNPSPSSRWDKIGSYSKLLIDGSVNVLAIDNSSTQLFIGGNFSRVSDQCGNNMSISDGAIWNINSNTFSPIGSFNLNGLNFYPNIFAMDTNNNVIYMGGNFSQAYNGSNSYVSINPQNIVGYDITNNKWIQLGNNVFNGVNGEVTGLSIDNNNGILYVSGKFILAYDSSNVSQSTNFVAVYNINTKTWGRLGSSTYNGTNAQATTIELNTNNQKIYVGGNFTSVYDSSNTTLTVKYMASFDITTNIWSRIGSNTTYNGVDASVNILEYNPASNFLLTIGNFSNVNDSVNTKIRNISKYAIYKF
jgi:hypothetical protein